MTKVDTAPALHLRTADGRQFRFTQPFTVGRSGDCDVCIDDSHISRKHISVEFSRGRWGLRDLQSSNGIFVNHQRVESVQIDKPVTLRLGGADGPLLVLQPEAAVAATVRAQDSARRYRCHHLPEPYPTIRGARRLDCGRLYPGYG